MDPRVADVTFSTVTVNSFWELAAPSQTMHVSVQSIFIEIPVKEKEHNCKNNQRNKPKTLLLSATGNATPAFHRLRFPLSVLQFPGTKAVVY